MTDILSRFHHEFRVFEKLPGELLDYRLSLTGNIDSKKLIGTEIKYMEKIGAIGKINNESDDLPELHNLSTDSESYRDGFMSVLSIAYFTAMVIKSGYTVIKRKHLMNGFMIPIISLTPIKSEMKEHFKKFANNERKEMELYNYQTLLAIGMFTPAIFETIMELIAQTLIDHGRLNDVHSIVTPYINRLNDVMNHIMGDYDILGIHANYTRYKDNEKYKYEMLGAHDATYLLHICIYSQNVEFHDMIKETYFENTNTLIYEIAEKIIPIKSVLVNHYITKHQKERLYLLFIEYFRYKDNLSTYILTDYDIQVFDAYAAEMNLTHTQWIRQFKRFQGEYQPPVSSEPIIHVDPEPVPEEPIVDPVPEEPIVEPVPEEPIVEPVPEEPIVEPLPEEPIVEPVTEEPIVEPVPEEPIVEPVPEEPIVEPVPEEPIVEPVPEEPIVEPVLEETIVEPVIEDPVVDLVLNERLTDPTKIESLFQLYDEKFVNMTWSSHHLIPFSLSSESDDLANRIGYQYRLEWMYQLYIYLLFKYTLRNYYISLVYIINYDTLSMVKLQYESDHNINFDTRNDDINSETDPDIMNSHYSNMNSLSYEENAYKEGFMSVIMLAYYSIMAIKSGYDRMNRTHIMSGFIIPIMALSEVKQDKTNNSWKRFVRSMKQLLHTAKYEVLLAFSGFNTNQYIKLMEAVVYNILSHSRLEKVQDIVPRYESNIKEAEKFVRADYSIIKKDEYGIHANYISYREEKNTYAMLGAHDATYLIYDCMMIERNESEWNIQYQDNFHQDRNVIIQYLSQKVITQERSNSMDNDDDSIEPKYIPNKPPISLRDNNAIGGNSSLLFDLFFHDTRTLTTDIHNNNDNNNRNIAAHRVHGCPRRYNRTEFNQYRRQENQDNDGGSSSSSGFLFMNSCIQNSEP